MKGKNIVVIGGNSGIGKGIVDMLKEQNAEVFTYSKSQDGDNELDIRSEFDHIEGLPETVHGLVYCPGTINLKPFHRIDISEFQADLEVNFLGAVKVLQAAQKALKKASGASVVLFSTVAVQTGMGFHASIASAKGALEGLTRSLAAEWANAGIRVNALAPSLTDTPLASSLLANDDKKEAAAKRHPLGRYGTVEDFAEAACFLLSEKSSWMTGQVIKIDGGMSVIK